MPHLRLASGMAAAVAIITLVASGAYLYGTSRPGPDGSALGPGPAASRMSWSGWQVVANPFPGAMDAATAPPNYTPRIFSLAGGGFVAFVPYELDAGGDPSITNSQWGLGAMYVPSETRVYTSADGLAWIQKSVLDNSLVSSIAESGGVTVAVGSSIDVAGQAETPTAWSTRDFQNWTERQIGTPGGPIGSQVVADPTGFLAWGGSMDRPDSEGFWASPDGARWTQMFETGLPTNVGSAEVLAVPGGYAIYGYLGNTQAIWQSGDGSVWEEVWTGPEPSELASYLLGQSFSAVGGGYISFGAYQVADATGQVGTQQSDIVVWTGTDLVHWNVSAQVHPPGWIDSYAAVRGRYLAAGNQPRSGDHESYLAIWTSVDGKEWQSAASLPIEGAGPVSVVSDGTHVVIPFERSLGGYCLAVSRI